MSQKNVSKFLAVFSLVAVVVATAGCGTATDTTVTTQPTDVDAGAAMTPNEVGAGAAMTPSDTGTDTITPPPTTPAATTPDTMTPPSSNPPATVPPTNKSSYKDGTYSADGSYRSPAGTETVGVTITLKGDVITKVTVVPKATDPKSVRFQGMFVSGISEVVVGKKIDALQVSKISGSSLTSGGFNEAVIKIEAQAKNS